MNGKGGVRYEKFRFSATDDCRLTLCGVGGAAEDELVDLETEETTMKDKFITITGMNHYFGLTPFAVGRKVKCTKEPSNPFDDDAIKVTMKHIGKVGYVANSVRTVATGTKSASRIYDKVPKKFKAEIMFIMPWYVIARVVEEEEEEGQA